MKSFTFLRKNRETAKRVVDFLMEIVEDLDEKSYNNNGKPWKSSRILRVNPIAFHFSFFFHHFSTFFRFFFFFFHFFIFLLFFILSILHFSFFLIFSFTSFFHLLHFFHFFSFFHFFRVREFQFLLGKICVAHSVAHSFILFLWCALSVKVEFPPAGPRRKSKYRRSASHRSFQWDVR